MSVLLREAGLTVTWQEQWSVARTTRRRRRCCGASGPTRATSPGRSGRPALTELIAAHELWSDWLGRGRVRKFALVAEKR